jgi:uncharacterized membrane protein YfcA
VSAVLVAVVGLAGGVLAGLFGVGGGIVFVPALTLGLGLTQVHAEASSLLAILPTAVVGTWRQRRYGNVDVRAAATVGLASVAGVQAGVLAALALPESVLRRLFGALVVAVAGQIAWRARQQPGG